MSGTVLRALKFTISSDLTCYIALYIAGSSYMVDDGSMKQNKVQMRTIHLFATSIPIFCMPNSL